MVLGKLFRKDPTAAAAAALYGRIVEQARQPAFYRSADVPDSLDGRFELIALHAFLVLHRLKREGEAGTGLAQSLFDTMFADMDASLRELGAGDLGVPHRIKRMVSGFQGRVAAYDAGLAGPDSELIEALRRNLYGTVAPSPAAAAALAAYLRTACAALAGQSGPALLAGELGFPPPQLGGDITATSPG
ncbi:MAG: ubiquinol-cytochrome C chaperone family protein [Kiloniellales bacterium]